jgi:long-chain acyl-CoA synthetase
LQHPWLNHYPSQVPNTVEPQAYLSMVQLLEASFQKNVDLPFCYCLGESMTYGELDARSKALAAWLQSLGLAKGTRVGLMLPNLPQFPVAMCAILRAGFVCVNINPLYTAPELEHQLSDSGCEVLVILENFAHTLSRVIERTPLKAVVITHLGDLLGPWKGPWLSFAIKYLARKVPAHPLKVNAHAAHAAHTFKASSQDPPLEEKQNPRIYDFTDVLRVGHPLPLKPSELSHEDTAFLQYTGGTTGLSKGAILSHGNILSATLQAYAWFTPSFTKVSHPKEINGIAALPLYHIFALTFCFLSIQLGSHLTLIPNPRDIKKFVKVLSEKPFHILPGVNTLFNALLQNEDFKKLDFSSLCLTQAGGMAASEQTATLWYRVTGNVMIEGWGMTETCAVGTNNDVLSPAFTGHIGVPLPSIEVVIKDDEGHTLPADTLGEICIKGPNVMKGYYRQPQENASAFTLDGFLRTGDLGLQNTRGETRLIDRKKDMILVSGFNVYPSEIESKVSNIPGVLECAAVAQACDKQGESVKLFLVKDPQAQHLTEEAVLAYCREHLTAYKIPKSIEFRDTLPKSNVGKVLRRALR